LTGGLGSWEQNPDSTAFVDRSERNNYVCGGTWIATREEFINMVQELDTQVAIDESRGVLATWHDESHLNKWASKNSHIILNPEFCYDASYPQLSKIIPVITAVDKKRKP
jgi:hypothetical protein